MSDNMDAPERPKNLLEYKSKIVGVTFENRQEIIKMLQGDEALRTRLEPENPVDPGAVAVDALIAETWNPIGYIAADKNKAIRNSMLAGNDVNIEIASLTGGEKQKNGKVKSLGVNIALQYEMGMNPPKAVEEKKVEANSKLQPQNANYKDMLNEALTGLGLIKPATHTEMYRSQLLGRSTTVVIKDGHVSIPGYMGGSSFPKQFYPEFNKDDAIQRILDKYFKPEEFERVKESILEMWNRSADSSNGYGTAVHAAMENYDKFRVLGDKTKKVEVLKTKTKVGPNKALSSNPFLAKIVQDFHDKFGGDYARLTEQFVWLHDKKLAGSIDRVKIIDADKKIVRIQDYKTNGDIHGAAYANPESPFRGVGKKALKEGVKQKDNIVEDTELGLYWLQLSFYAYILKQYGYTVEGLDIYWLNPEKLCRGENAWEEYSHEVINIDNVIEEGEK